MADGNSHYAEKVGDTQQIYICMLNHNDDTIKTSDTVLRKYSSHFIESVVCERELETKQNCNILTLYSIGHNHVSFPFSWAAQPGTWGPSLSGCWFSLLHLFSNSSDLQTDYSGVWGLPLLGAGFLYRILSPTDWISCALSYIIVQRPPSSCGRHKAHSFNPFTVKVMFCYSSTGCACYLYTCIS